MELRDEGMLKCGRSLKRFCRWAHPYRVKGPAVPVLQVPPMRRLLVPVSLLLASPGVLFAQGKAVAPVAARPVMVAPRVVVQTPHPVTRAGGPVGTPVARINGGGVVGVRPAKRATYPVSANRGAYNPPFQFNDFNNEDEGDFYPTPGLGFDMTHLAATRGQRAVGFHRRPGGIVGFGGGYLFYPGTEIVEQPAMSSEEQGAVETDDSATSEPVSNMSRRNSRSSSYSMEQRRAMEAPPVTSVDTVETPQREPEQYVFVKRDGTLFFAVGYSWDKGFLRYITQDGLRKSVESNSIDLNATQQFNEQRGLSFRLPS